MRPRCSPLRILVVEDEWLIADLVEAELRDAGFEVVGPASNARMALALVDHEQFDAAVLDVSLGGGYSFVVAEALAERGIPFFFTTGYVNADLPSAFRNYQVLTKPFRAGSLAAHVKTDLVPPARQRCQVDRAAEV